MRSLSWFLSAAWCLGGCTASPSVQTAPLLVDSGDSGPGEEPAFAGRLRVGFDLDLDWSSPEAFELIAVITFSGKEIRLNPGGTAWSRETIEGCEVATFDPDSDVEELVDRDAETLDAGPYLTLRSGGLEVEVPARDEGARRYYVLESGSDDLPLGFPLSMDLVVPPNDGEVPDFTVPAAALLPVPPAWFEPAELLDRQAEPYPSLGALQPLDLAWTPATQPWEDESFVVWLNATGWSGGQEFWQQVSCPVEDTGAFTVGEPLLAAIASGDDPSLRTLAVTRTWQAVEPIGELRAELSVHVEQNRWGCYWAEGG